MTDPNSSELIKPLDLTELAAKLVTDSVERIWKKIVELGMKAGDEIKYQLTDVYRDYLVNGISRYAYVKTLLYRHEPVALHEFYVPLTLKSKSKSTVIRSAGMTDVLKLSKRLVIVGSAGMGKSTLLKHLFVDAIRTQSIIPLFVELRQLNGTNLDLLEFIAESVLMKRVSLNKDYLIKGFESGKFALLLDAYDEVNIEIRESVRKAIFQLAERYPGAHIVLSSRPDEEFIAWTHFSEYAATPLTQPEAVTLASKLRFDKDVKDRFIAELHGDLYKEHESFVSNPLLLTIMLMTYSVNAAIPRKRHVFYAQVFQALFNQHDATKEAGYRRQLKTKLAVDDFQRVLAAFSIQSYLQHELTFGRDSAIKYLKTAKDMTGLSFDEGDFLADMLKAVCLLVQDGLYYTFTHKQFQEYFTADFINHSDSKGQRKLLSSCAPGFGPNDVVKLLFEMNPPLVERIFILPGIKKIFKQIGYASSAGDECLIKLWQLQIHEILLRIKGASEDVLFLPKRGVHVLNFIRFIQGCYSGTVLVRRVGSARDTRAQLLRALKQASPHGGNWELKTDELEKYPEVVKSLRGYFFLGVEHLKYLADVKDFIEMRQGTRTTSLEQVLRPPRRRS